jgi:tRNA (cmo5U34)-methyltransferase
VTAIRDEHLADGPWRFDQAVCDCFDDMLARSIPDYATLRSLIRALASEHAQPESLVVDLGCSRGTGLADVRAGIGLADVPGVRYLGIDSSDPMVAAASERFAGSDDVTIARLDLHADYPRAVNASVTMAVLTLQFLAPRDRAALVAAAARTAAPGGIFLLVEKVEPRWPVFSELYIGHKRQSGYSDEQIETKAVALEGVLVPNRPAENVLLLERNGWTDVECFWRWLNFAGWIARRSLDPLP